MAKDKSTKKEVEEIKEDTKTILKDIGAGPEPVAKEEPVEDKEATYRLSKRNLLKELDSANSRIDNIETVIESLANTLEKVAGRLGI